MLRTRPRKSGAATKISYEVLGTGSGAEALKETIRGLDNYPAASERRVIVDVMDLISAHHYRICFAECSEDGDGLETWTVPISCTSYPGRSATAARKAGFCKVDKTGRSKSLA